MKQCSLHKIPHDRILPGPCHLQHHVQDALQRKGLGQAMSRVCITDLCCMTQLCLAESAVDLLV